MTVHPALEELKAFKSKTLKPNRLLQLSAHLKECVACRETIASFVPGIRHQSTTHLTYEQKEAYLDNQLTWKERESVEGHIRECKTCAAELLHLTRLSELVMQTDQAQPKWSSGNRLRSFLVSLAPTLVGTADILVTAAAISVVLLTAFLWRSPAPAPQPVMSRNTTESPITEPPPSPVQPSRGSRAATPVPKSSANETAKAAEVPNDSQPKTVIERRVIVAPTIVSERRVANVVTDPVVEVSGPPASDTSSRAEISPNSVGRSSGITSKATGGVTPPSVISRVEPLYTDEARQAHYQGTVIIRAIIRKDGTVDIVQVIKGLEYGLNESAVDALKQWKFKPGMRNGEPEDVPLNIEVQFNLRTGPGPLR